MNSLPILIIGAPAVLAVIAYRLHARDNTDAEPTYVFLEEDWEFPPRWREVSRTEER